MFKKIGFIITFFACFAGTSYAQAVDCPPDLVCITRAAALKAVADADKVVALEAESAAKDKAIADMRDLLNKMRIEFAEKSGEVTALKQNAVSDRALIEVLVKFARPKKIGLINLF